LGGKAGLRRTRRGPAAYDARVEYGDVETLVRRAAAGDRKAADDVLRRLEPWLRGEIHRHLGPEVRVREDTDDALQSTLLSVADDLVGFEWRGEEAFRAWLLTLARHRIASAGRDQRRDKRDPAREQPLVSGDAVLAQQTTPSLAAAREESSDLLREAVDRLAPDERRVVELHSWQDLPFGEVARLCGLPDEDAARYLFRKALKKLGEQLDDGP